MDSITGKVIKRKQYESALMKGKRSIRGKPVYRQARKLTVVEDYPDASTVFRSQGRDICGFFRLYGLWNDGLDGR